MGVLLASFFIPLRRERCSNVFLGVIDDFPEIFEDATRLKVRFGEKRAYLYVPLYPEFFYGDVVEVRGRPQTKDHMPFDICGIYFFPAIKRLSRDGGEPLQRMLFRLREKFDRALTRIFHEPQASLASSLLLGRHGGGGEWQEAFRQSGLSHLTALSGFNITILIVAVEMTLRIFHRTFRFWIAVLVIFLFVLLTGASPSVVRASLMGGVWLFGKTIGRPSSPLHSLLLAAFFIVFVEPRIIRFDLGFQLSFLATLGLTILSPSIQKHLPLKTYFREIISTTLSAQLFTLPLLVTVFHSLNPFAFVANLFVLPVIPILMGLTFFSGFLTFFTPFLGQLIGFYTDLLLRFVLFISKAFSIFSISW